MVNALNKIGKVIVISIILVLIKILSIKYVLEIVSIIFMNEFVLRFKIVLHVKEESISILECKELFSLFKYNFLQPLFYYSHSQQSLKP